MISRVRRFLGFFYAVPWCVPAWGSRELAATVRAILTGSAVSGPHPERFAAAVREFLGVKHALPVNRGRTAIELGLRAMGVGAGDDVVMPSFVCRSVLDGVLSAGATPVFADIDATLNITASTVKDAITPRTKCVIVAHLFGNSAAVDEIERVLRPHGIALMDDAAQAFGAYRAGKPVGSFGTCGIVSCGPGKPLAGAAGGLLLTNDDRLFERASAIALTSDSYLEVVGRTLGFWVTRRLRRYTLPFTIVLERLSGRRERPHVNRTMSNLDGAIALAQLEALRRNAENRCDNAELLRELLGSIPGTTMIDAQGSLPVKLVHLLPEAGPTVAEGIEILARHGIEAQGGYAPLHASTSEDRRMPGTAALWKRVLCVPLETRPPTRGLPRFARRAGCPTPAPVAAGIANSPS